MLLLVICFPIWIVFAWIYEVTPEGIKKTSEVDEGKSISNTTNKRLNILILTGLVVLIALTLFKPNTNSIYSANKKEFAIAVLPFDDMSSKKDTEWFCDGMTEDILTYLSKVKGLKVVSRTSTERYKNTDKTIPEIANELGVSYVVEGSVRKHNDDVLITAQLINADDEHIWVDNFNEKMKDVFKMQGDVSKKIVQQLKISISPKEEEEFNIAPTKNIKAYEAYLKGRSLFEKLDPENMLNSITFFEKAIELDPNYADAYAERAFVKMISKTDMNTINADLTKALELNPNSSRANSYNGIALFGLKKEKEALKYLEKAIQLNPNDEKAHDMMASYYSNVKTGDIQENKKKALFHANESISLNPFSTQSNFVKIMTLVSIGELDEAEKTYNKKKGVLSNFVKIEIITEITKRRAEGSKKGPQIDEINIYKAALKKYPFASSKINRYLAGAYDGILNDQESYLKYAKLAFEQDTTYFNAISEYHTALIESGKFEIAEKLRNSTAYNNKKNRVQKLFDLQYSEYHKGNYKNCLAILIDSLETNIGIRRALAYAQLNDRKNLNPIIPKLTSNAEKTMVYAVLKNSDSVFYFLNKTNVTTGASFVNSRKEMNPYRKDSRYIEFLKKYRFPVELQKN